LFPPEITSKLVEAVARPELSRRERQVLEYLANGRSNKEIGAILYVSEVTVKGHVRSILESWTRRAVLKPSPSRLIAG